MHNDSSQPISHTSTRFPLAVVIPFHNREKHLEETLCSVYQQSYRPLEVILVDNRSTDASVRIARQFKEQYQSPQFKITLLHEEKEGANAARNKGLYFTQAPYLCFFDSDDQMYPYMIQKIVKAITAHPVDLLLYTHRLRSIDGKETIKTRSRTTDLYTHLLRGLAGTQDFTVKTDFLKQIGGWDETLFRWQDWELVTRMLLHAPSIYRLPSPPLSLVVAHERSISGTTYHHSATHLQHTTEVVYNYVYNCDHPARTPLLRAVCFRFALLAGCYDREGEKALAHHTFQHLCTCYLLHSRYLRFIYFLLYRYTALGGRGAWRLARILL